MKPRFEPEADPSARPPATLVDPEGYDASEQQFAASLEAKPARPPQFVVEGNEESLQLRPAGAPAAVGDAAPAPQKNALAEDPGQPSEVVSAPTHGSELCVETKPETVASKVLFQTELLETQDSDSWRREVAARVNKYRARRRTHAPRYPSLQLKFDTPEPSPDIQVGRGQPPANLIANRLAVATTQDTLSAVPLGIQTAPALVEAAPADVTETSAKIIEFPRAMAAPPPVFDELAESVFECPRILEVPDLLPPPPALGGMLIEAAEEPPKEKRRGFELPLQAAPMSRRFMAAAIDGLLVVLAFTIFAYVSFRITAVVPPLRQSLGISAILMGAFWTAYKYALLVHVGTTPGLKLAKLQLTRFDGSPVPETIRRWRVLASVLSGLSLALGYAWCFLDEDRLCWHDRITHTYMAPKAPEQAAGA